jgi:CRISPR system Cascade subunit CasB
MKDERIAENARGWWKTFIEPDHSSARATRARLRRVHSWQEAMFEPTAIILAKRLGVVGDDRLLPIAFDLAAVLAHVKKDTLQPLMRELGYKTTPAEKDKGEPPRLAGPRFTRLLRSSSEELPTALIRLVQLADGTANVGELAIAMMRWAFDASREAQRRRWAFDYYAASDAAPDANTNTGTYNAEGNPA